MRAGSSCLFVVVLVTAALAWVLPFRQPDCNTGSHFALVQSLAAGSKTIDRVHGQSCDISWWHGHYYANKAPGLALATLPWYGAVKAAGWLQPDPASGAAWPSAMRMMPRRNLWLMALWGSILPALGLLVLVRRTAERILPGTGTSAAAILAFATLLAPFGGLFFSHALSAFLAFAAFVTATATPRLRNAAGAGLLAGAAIVVEYPDAIVAVGLACFIAVTGRQRIERAAAFAAGVLAGVSPLLLYGWWAFGSPLHLSYVGAVLRPGVSGHDVLGANSVGFFGVEVPDVGRLLAILGGSRGLLVVSPVLALAPWGFAALWRAGRRAEVAAAAGICGLFVLYNAGYYSPLGGATPGPRFLIAILPLLSIAVAAVARERPVTLVALFVVSSLMLLAADLTQPLISAPYSTHDWRYWIEHGDFTSTLLGPNRHGWEGASVLALAVAAGVTAGTRSLPEARRKDIRAGIIAVAAWSCGLWFEGLSHTGTGVLTICACLVALLLSGRVRRAGAVAACAAAVVLAAAPNPTLTLTMTLLVAVATVVVAVVFPCRHPSPLSD